MKNEESRKLKDESRKQKDESRMVRQAHQPQKAER